MVDRRGPSPSTNQRSAPSACGIKSMSAKIIAASYKDMSNPKIGLTMRQHRLGAAKWIKEDINKSKKEETKK